MIRSPAGFDGGDRIKRYLDYYQPSYGVMMLSAGQFSPALLFAAGEQGVWYDPSDFSTMFQDSAGTTPVTAVEQPVGLILDKSGRGNHASQSVSGTEPVLSARVNQFVQTENFSAADWAKSTATATVDTITATGAFGNVYQTFTKAALNIQYKLVVELSPGNVSAGRLTLSEVSLSSGGVGCDFTLTGSGTAGTPAAYGTGWTVGTAQIEALADGWYRCTLTATSSGSTGYAGVIGHTGSAVATNTIKARKADIRAANDGVGIPVYQAVVTSTNYTTSGFPLYLRFDGSDDSLATGSINPGVDKAQIFAGARKFSLASSCVAETSSSIGANNGSVSLFVSGSVANDWNFASKGTVIASANSVVLPPVTNVITGIADISGDVAIMRLNGAQVSSVTTDQGTGNYLAYPLYIGRRGGTTFPFSGRIYSLILRFGANLNAATITNTETWVNGKTMVY